MITPTIKIIFSLWKVPIDMTTRPLSLFIIFLWRSVAAATNATKPPSPIAAWELTNVRGYFYYPEFGANDYENKKLEILFDFNLLAVPSPSYVDVECWGYKNCTRRTFSQCGVADWYENQTDFIWPYRRIFFNVQPQINQYFCRGKVSDSWRFSSGPWSETGLIDLSIKNSIIDPKPALAVCQALKYPPKNYGQLQLIRVLDVDSAKGANETVLQKLDTNCNLVYDGQGLVATYEKMTRFDWIGNWKYTRLKDLHTIVKTDDLHVEEETSFSFPDLSILNFQYYAPKNFLFFTAPHPTNYSMVQLFRYDIFHDSSRLIVGAIDSIACNVSISHSWFVIDWRDFWKSDQNQEATIVFLSGRELWRYIIERDSCERMLNLSEFGIQSQNISCFDVDWQYFYWINSRFYNISTFSWETGEVKQLSKVRIFKAEIAERAYQVDEPIYDKLNYVVGIMTYNSASRPFPLLMECLIPDLVITVAMLNATNGWIMVNNLWNESDACYRTNLPPVQMKLKCVSIGLDLPCDVGVNVYRGRENRHSVDLKNLVLDNQYKIIILVSLTSNEKFCKRFEHVFTAKMVNEGWTELFIIVALLICVIIFLISAIFAWYRRRKTMRDFLQRERVDASQLSLIDRLGQGEFGEVWLARYHSRKCHHKNSTEVAVKMRKRIDVSFRSTLLSADCFFQEAMTLDVLRHPNIVLAYGVCMNYEKLPPILVLEYMNGGNCVDYVKRERERLSGADLALICRDVLRACVHLSSKNIIHKDIGARNVLIRKFPVSSKPQVAKLTDFGLAREINQKERFYVSSNSESIFHVSSTAPEGFDGRFSSKSDVWSFGVFVWELYQLIDFNEPIPYSQLAAINRNSILEFLKRGGTLGRPRAAPDDVFILMRQCWALEPSERPEFKQLIAAWRLIGNSDDQRLLIGLSHHRKNHSESLHRRHSMANDSGTACEVEMKTATTGYVQWQ